MSALLAWKGLVRRIPFSKNEDRADTVYKEWALSKHLYPAFEIMGGKKLI